MTKHEKYMIERARELRRQMTPSEWLLWDYLRDRRLAGHRFRRQHPIGPYIADFVCLDRRLVVEVDGDHHGFQNQAAYDAHRTQWLEKQGFRVYRVWSQDVFEAIEGVLVEITQLLEFNRLPRQRGR